MIFFDSPRQSIFLLLAVVVMCSTASPSTRAQGTWTTVTCNTSPFNILTNAICQKIDREVGSGAVEAVRGTDYNVSGRVGDTTFLSAYYPPFPGASGTLKVWGAYSVADSEKLIRGSVGPGAVEFSSYQGFDHTGFMTFRRNSQYCVGFDHGKPQGSGYEFFIRGMICSPTPIASPKQSLQEFLSALAINVMPSAIRTNAFGGTPSPLPWRDTPK